MRESGQKVSPADSHIDTYFRVISFDQRLAFLYWVMHVTRAWASMQALNDVFIVIKPEQVVTRNISQKT